MLLALGLSYHETSGDFQNTRISNGIRMHTMMQRLTCCFSFFLLAAIFTGHVQAVLPGISFDGIDGMFDRDWMSGYEFQVTRPITVTALGKFDGNANGTLDDSVAPQVGLWDATSGDLLRSTMIPTNTVSSGGAFNVSIDPFVLTPGTYVMGTQAFNEKEPIMLADSLSMAGGMRWMSGRRRSGTEFLEPDRRLASLGLLGPSFLIDEKVLLQQPVSGSIYQRNESNLAHVPVQGILDLGVDRVEARYRPTDGNADPGWSEMTVLGNTFSGAVMAPAGLSVLEVRGWNNGQLVGTDQVDDIGVGEVFVIAGQSNSANHGSPPQVSQSGMVGAMDEVGTWQTANDPLPVATGSGGSPWPILGDLLASKLKVPIGFASVGWGGTRVDQWLPGGSLYPRIDNALQHLKPNGARAVLWHQGESDALSSTSTETYAERLRTVIDQSRQDAGFELSWGVARAAFLPSTTLAQEAAVVNGQQRVIDGDATVFPGPFTDDITGPEWRYDNVHFNQAGLEEHARRWADAIATHLIPEPNDYMLLLCALGWLVQAARRESYGRHLLRPVHSD